MLALAACGGSGTGSSSPSPTAPSPTPAPSTPSPQPAPNPAPAPAGCTLSVTNLPGSLPAQGGSYDFTLSIGSGCAWTATTDVTWGTISPGSGIGSTSPTLRLDDHTRSDGRTLTVTINTQSWTVIQEGIACVYTLSASAFDARNEGQALNLHVSTQAGCRWSATSANSWIAVQTQSGAGPDYVYFTVAPNTGDARQGSITVAGQRVIINQARG
jgi:hypothetical protein